MERKIIYGAGRPHFESNVVLLLNSFFRLLFLVAKFFLFIGRLPFVGGIDNKKIIKKEPDVESPERRCKKIKG